MHYIIYLCLEGFFVQIKAPDHPSPVAVVRDNTVLDVNAQARQRGITPGMEKRTARAIAHETKFYAWEEDAYEDAQTRWLYLCTEFTGIIEPEEQNSAYLDLSAHPNPIDVAEKLIRTLAQETSLRVFYGSSINKWIAKLACQHGDCGTAAIDPAKFLSSLPIHNLTPIRSEHRQRLNFLGYRTIGEVLTIPEDILRQQFGAEGLLIAKAARGDFMVPLSANYPRDSLIETLIFESPVDSLETIDLGLKDLATRAAQRLSNKSLQGQELQLSMEFENGKTIQLKRRFSKPIYTFLGVLSTLRILFQKRLADKSDTSLSPLTTNAQVTPTLRAFVNPPCLCVNDPGSFFDPLLQSAVHSPINSLRLCMTNLKHARGKQNSLLGKSKGDSATAVNVVRTVFGDASVQLGSEIPTPRRIRVLREWKNATGWS